MLTTTLSIPGLAAGMYSGLTYGLKEARGTHDWILQMLNASNHGVRETAISCMEELDIANVRATNHVERPAKEKYIKAIFAAISATRPRADVAYCIHALARRLSKAHNWAVRVQSNYMPLGKQ
ncbi:hypothetical protein Vadar_024097 [Vaccinium darrowii]|uniref:Uncharacterized protein n=1 Tax=Vaccinium darrowii TaxID=229202 RepID=A0ACB7YYW0_9ERIC|nr:hypothetical protein Vadar_024097 [Vaccinium darrowii]